MYLKIELFDFKHAKTCIATFRSKMHFVNMILNLRVIIHIHVNLTPLPSLYKRQNFKIFTHFI